LNASDGSCGRAVGINVTLFNVALDRNGSIATAFVHALAFGLRKVPEP
jgi:hypothetical protein